MCGALCTIHIILNREGISHLDDVVDLEKLKNRIVKLIYLKYINANLNS